MNLCVELALTKLGQTDEAAELLYIIDPITQRSALLQDVEKQRLSYDTPLARGECCIELGEWDKAETSRRKRSCGDNFKPAWAYSWLAVSWERGRERRRLGTWVWHTFTKSRGVR